MRAQRMNKFIYGVMKRIVRILGPLFSSIHRVSKNSIYLELLEKYEAENEKLRQDINLAKVKNTLLKKQNERLEMRNQDLKSSVHILACDCLAGEVKNIKKDLLKI